MEDTLAKEAAVPLCSFTSSPVNMPFLDSSLLQKRSPEATEMVQQVRALATLIEDFEFSS